MTTASLSGAVSILVLVFAVLKRTGILDTLMEAAKKRFQDRRSVIDKPLETEIKLRGGLETELSRHEEEQARLDAEFEVLKQFLERRKR